jgi:hypothetical protein
MKRDTQHSDTQHNCTQYRVLLVMRSVIFAECDKLVHYAEWHYAACRHVECRYAECRGAIHITKISCIG